MDRINGREQADKTSAALREPLLEHPSLGASVVESPHDVSDSTSTPSSARPREARMLHGLPLGTALLLKSLYFLQALGSAAWGRFGTIYYNLHGLNSQQVGLLEGCMPFVRTLSQPMWSMIADQFHCRKAVYLFTNGAGTIVLLSLALPYVYSSYSRIMTVSLITMLFAGSGILDAYTLDMLGTQNKMLYGRYRMWSSISWGIGAIVMGYVTDHYGFEPNFIIYGILAAVCIILVAWRIPNVAGESRPDTGKVGDLLRLMMRPRVSIFLLEIIIMGAGMATVERLLFLYLVNDLGSSTLLCGLSVGVNVLFELPIFWHAEALIALLGGHDGMLALSLLCFVTRVFGYTLLTPTTVWYILPLEAMHGVTFACFWVSMTDVAKVLIHQVEGWNTTIPTLVQTLFSAMGTGLGSIVGGWAMHRYGARTMYRVVAAILLGTLLLHILGSVLCRLVSKRGLLPEDNQDPPSPTDHEEDEEDQPQQNEEEEVVEQKGEVEALLGLWGVGPVEGSP